LGVAELEDCDFFVVFANVVGDDVGVEARESKECWYRSTQGEIPVVAKYVMGTDLIDGSRIEVVAK
jgi:hypothetical protein